MTPEKTIQEQYAHVPKSWGYELWIVNNDEYCGKLLHFTGNGAQTSMHFHVLKRETMYCTQGSFEILMVDTADGSQSSVHLEAGESVEIPRLTPHKIMALQSGSELFEFSTTHFDEDSYRVWR